MPVRVPDRVREVWGDEMVVEMAPWLQEMIQEYGVPRDEYREVLSRLDRLEKDTSLIKEEVRGVRGEVGQLRDQLRTEFKDDLGELRLEMHERFDRMNTRFDGMNARFDKMGARFDGRLGEMNTRFEERFDEMNHRLLVQTRWLVGSITVLGTIISILLAIAQFAP